jgi:hypothetical protein
MVTSENDFVLVVTENAALEFAWNGHAVPSLPLFYSSFGKQLTTDISRPHKRKGPP